MSHSEARVSINVKLTGPNGGDFLLTVRDGATRDDVEQTLYSLVEGLKSARNEYHLVVACSKNNTVSVVPSNGNENAPEREAPACQYHGPMKPSQYGGWYCPSKMGDGSYCKEKAK